MKSLVLRGLARASCHFAERLLPPSLSLWAEAMAGEVAAIEDDGEALVFALGCLRGAAGERLVMIMRKTDSFAALCGVGAVLCGLVYLALADAPLLYLGTNFGALLLGLATLAIIRHMPALHPAAHGWLVLAGGAIMVGTSIFGLSAEGATRWLALGPVIVQPSLILVPAMIMAFAAIRTPLAAWGIALAALALAVQPDRAMAGALVAGMAVCALARRDRIAMLALASAAAGFLATMVQPDRLPAVPFVDQILYSAFSVSIFAGVMVLVGAVLVVLPAIGGTGSSRQGRGSAWLFGAIWLAILAAALLGNYPAPLVGYGASAILGYLLSAGLLANRSSCPIPSPAPAASRPGLGKFWLRKANPAAQG